MRHWEKMGGEPIGGMPLSAPREEDPMKPWTWEEIAALRDQKTLTLEQERVRERFLVDYGDRAKVALMAAGHEPGTIARCVFAHSPCERCPLDFRSRWSRSVGIFGCGARAMAVYARMVKKLGLLPEVR
jgi:hypothetical protein